MNKISAILVLLMCVVFFSCNFSGSSSKRVPFVQMQSNEKEATLLKGDSIIAQAILAHGGDRYDFANYSFVFRKKKYDFVHTADGYRYQVSFENDNGQLVKDVLINGAFTRYVNQQVVNLSEKDVTKYSEALNSVIYFATLPHKLGDMAVNKKYHETTTIHGKQYYGVEVFFDKEGGGTDYDDTYYYWVNTDTNIIDYLAYNYTVNGGGARFRSAYNRRVVGGIVFQDYINWKADKGISLSDLPVLYESKSLLELSKIKTENVRSNE